MREFKTEQELQDTLDAMGELDLETKKRVACNLIGHSKIVNACLGYVHCERCKTQIGDTLGGVFDLRNKVIVDHVCDECTANYESSTWKDRFLVDYKPKEPSNE